jgi:hypothetical protein
MAPQRHRVTGEKQEEQKCKRQKRGSHGVWFYCGSMPYGFLMGTSNFFKNILNSHKIQFFNIFSIYGITFGVLEFCQNLFLI